MPPFSEERFEFLTATGGNRNRLVKFMIRLDKRNRQLECIGICYLDGSVPSGDGTLYCGKIKMVKDKEDGDIPGERSARFKVRGVDPVYGIQDGRSFERRTLQAMNNFISKLLIQLLLAQRNPAFLHEHLKLKKFAGFAWDTRNYAARKLQIPSLSFNGLTG